MAGKLRKFQMQGFTTFAKMAKENHLGSLYQTAPQKATNITVQLLANNRGKSLDTFLSQFPTKEFDSDAEYYWDIIGTTNKHILLVEARDENGTIVTSTSGNVGAGTAPFYLVFNTDWFAKGEVIVGHLNQEYLFRVLAEPTIEGSNYLYRVELMGGNTSGCPAERLLVGERFSIEYAPVEKELSRKVGNVRYAGTATMRNEWSRIRIHTKVPGNMLGKKLKTAIPVLTPTADGKTKETLHEMWMTHVEWQLDMEFAGAKQKVLAYGRSNRNLNGEYLNFGDSGNAIQMGDGLFAQIEGANTHYYNTFSLRLLEVALTDLAASKLDFGDRVFVLNTGEYGAMQFNKAVDTEVSGWTQFIPENKGVNMIRKTDSKLHTNALSAGYQFTEYQAPNGITLKLNVDPMYDDKYRNKIYHKDGGVAMSYRYDILYMGTMDQPNIFKCAIKGQGDEIKGIQWGLRNPFTGESGNANMAYDEDSASMHKMCTTGVCVLDPTRTVSFIPSILAV